MEAEKIQYKVRQAGPEDSKFLADNTADLSLETENKECNMELTTKFLKMALDRPNEIVYFIASSEGKDIASCGCTYEYNVVDNTMYLWYQSVFVAKDFRGKGVFRALFNHAQDIAKERGYKGVRLYVERNNEVARTIYQKYGFEFVDLAIWEADTVFAFNALDYDPDTTKNKQTHIDNFKAFLQDKSIDGEVKLEYIKKGEEGRKQLEELKEVAKIDTWVPLIQSKKQDKNDLKGGLASYLEQKDLGKSFFVKLGDNFIGILNSFDEFSDWRGGLSNWVYDLRMSEEHKQNWQTIIGHINVQLFNVMDHHGIVNWRWQISKADLELFGSVLEGQKFVRYGDDVMHKQF